MISDKEIAYIKNIVAELEKNVNAEDGTWLDKFNASQAWVVVIGAGPWRISRRKIIQEQALMALGNYDLSEFENAKPFNYPLTWQFNKTDKLIKYLRTNYLTMDSFIQQIKHDNPARKLYEITETKGRAKVIDLYVRDYLKVPAFPIDRWVKRKLAQYNLPINENYMIKLCQKAGLDVNYVARLFVGGFSGNAALVIK